MSIQKYTTEHDRRTRSNQKPDIVVTHTAVRSDKDRSPEAIAFLNAVTEVCRKHGYSIGHEDSQGGFQIYKEDSPTDPNMNEWFMAATEIITK